MIRYLVGAHGTGKSTLLEACRKIYPKPFYSEGVTRPVVRALKTLEIEDDRVEQEIINELTIAAYKTQINNTDILCTRSIIDLIVYNKVFYPSEIDTINSLIKIWDETREKVDLLIYTPIEFPLVGDEIRSGIFTKVDIQKKIDEEFQLFLSKEFLDGKVVIVTGSVEERLNQLQNFF